MKSNSPTTIPNTNQCGAALVTSIFVLLLITVMAMTLTFIGHESLTISINDRRNTQAFYIAQAGASHAANIIINSDSSKFGNILAAGDGQADTGDELSVQPTGYSGPPFVAIPSSGVSFAGGTYKVYVRDDINPAPSTQDTNSTVMLTSVGSGADGSTATIELKIGGTNLPAILANGDATISGSPEIRGSEGSMFANGSISDSGHPCADVYIGSASTISKPDSVKTGAGCHAAGDARQNQPTMIVPTLNIRSFVNQSTYVLASDGHVYNGSSYTGHGPDSIGNSPWNGWTWNSGSQLWSSSGGTAPPSGTYYVEGSLKMNGAWGGNLQTLTFIAEGYIDTSGAPVIEPALAGYTYISGNDILFTGSGGTVNNPGLIYAANQLRVTGSASFYGSMVIANVNDNVDAGGTNLLRLDSNGVLTMTGSPTVTYNGGGPLGSVKVLGWREVRN